MQHFALGHGCPGEREGRAGSKAKSSRLLQAEGQDWLLPPGWYSGRRTRDSDQKLDSKKGLTLSHKNSLLGH